MKKLILLLIGLSSISSFAQFEHVFIRGGYQIGASKSNSALFSYAPNYSTTPPSAIHTDLREVRLPTAAIPVYLEGLGQNIYMDFGFSFRREKESKEITNLFGKEAEQFRLRLGFGDYIGENFGILVGGQLHYNEMRLNYKNSQRKTFGNTAGGQNSTDNYYINYAGGWQYGLGAHLVFNHENFLGARMSFMYDWVNDRGIPGNSGYGNYLFTGNALIGELAFYWMFDEDSDFGLAIHAGFNTRTLEMGYDNEDNNSIAFVPENTISGYYASISLCIPAVIFGSAESRRTIITFE